MPSEMTARDELFDLIQNIMLKDSDKESRIWFGDTSWKITDSVIDWALSRVGEDMPYDETINVKGMQDTFGYYLGRKARGEEIRGRLKGEGK
jgi:hypothetical protein